MVSVHGTPSINVYAIFLAIFAVGWELEISQHTSKNFCEFFKETPFDNQGQLELK